MLCEGFSSLTRLLISPQNTPAGNYMSKFSRCPLNNCSGGSPGRQHEVSDSLLKEMRENGFPEVDYVHKFMRCSYCQAIYGDYYEDQTERYVRKGYSANMITPYMGQDGTR